jgi:hypothetical protein
MIIVMSGHATAHDERIPDAVQFLRKPFPLVPLAKWLQEAGGAAAPR